MQKQWNYSPRAVIYSTSSAWKKMPVKQVHLWLLWLQSCSLVEVRETGVFCEMALHNREQIASRMVG